MLGAKLLVNLDSRIRPSSLTEKALGQLREAILRADHAPGTALRLDALQRQYGLSSSPLREALNRLVSEGLVRQDSNRGFRVSTVSLDELRDLTEMRLLLEPEALRRSIAYGDDTWEGRIVAAHHTLRKAEEGQTLVGPTIDEAWSQAHRAFHMALLGGAPSLRLRRQCASLFAEAERYRKITAHLRRRPRDKGAEHAALMAAALDRDAARAAELLSNHIKSTFENMVDVLQAIEETPRPARVRGAV